MLDMEEMVERVNNLEKLGEIIRGSEATKVLYDLGEGKGRTELLVTHMAGDSRMSHRVSSSPLVRLYGDGLMDIVDSDKGNDAYSYLKLKPVGVEFTVGENQPYELGDLVVDLEGGSRLAIAQFVRAE